MKRLGVVIALAFACLGARGTAVSRGTASGRTTAGQVASYTPGNCSDANMAAWFDFDQGNGALTVPTRCAAGGTAFAVTGSPVYSASAPTGLGNAITFGGAAGFNTAGDVDALDFGTSDAVIECWVKMATYVSQGRLLDKSSATSAWRVDISAGIRMVTIDATGHACTAIATTPAANDNAWHHWRGTWDYTNKVCTSQIDSGSVVSTSAPTSTGTLGNTQAVGIANRTAASFFTGSFADCTITIGNKTNALPITTTLNTRGTASGRSTHP